MSSTILDQPRKRGRPPSKNKQNTHITSSLDTGTADGDLSPEKSRSRDRDPPPSGAPRKRGRPPKGLGETPRTSQREGGTAHHANK